MYNKYLKYKLKYINLKKQVGGSSISSLSSVPPASEFYLPCEINHLCTEVQSKKFFELNSMFKSILKSDSEITVTAGLPGLGYNQDPFIQLYNGINSYYNIFNGHILHLSDIFKTKSICSSQKCVLKHNSNENKREITIGNEVKIPYGFTLIEGTIINQQVNVLPGTLNTDQSIYIDIPEIRSSEGEQSKGGNFISGIEDSDGIIPIFYIDGIDLSYNQILSNLPKHKMIELSCSFKSNGFRHIDEVMCLMGYGKDKFKVWFYDKFTESTANFNELNTEREINLNKVSNALFGTDFHESKDKFVFFPYSHNIPSIFNRVWIEKTNECICLLPTGWESSVAFEITQLKSYLTGVKTIVYFVNVPSPNQDRPEGGAHCMIKQRFSKS